MVWYGYSSGFDLLDKLFEEASAVYIVMQN